MAFIEWLVFYFNRGNRDSFTQHLLQVQAIHSRYARHGSERKM